MINKVPVKAVTGHILGWIEEDTVTGNKTVRDFYGRILGKYEKHLDLTRDFYGKIIARGDHSSMLLNLKK